MTGCEQLHRRRSASRSTRRRASTGYTANTARCSLTLAAGLAAGGALTPDGGPDVGPPCRHSAHRHITRSKTNVGMGGLAHKYDLQSVDRAVAEARRAAARRISESRHHAPNPEVWLEAAIWVRHLAKSASRPQFLEPLAAAVFRVHQGRVVAALTQAEARQPRQAEEHEQASVPHLHPAVQA